MNFTDTLTPEEPIPFPSGEAMPQRQSEAEPRAPELKRAVIWEDSQPRHAAPLTRAVHWDDEKAPPVLTQSEPEPLYAKTVYGAGTLTQQTPERLKFVEQSHGKELMVPSFMRPIKESHTQPAMLHAVEPRTPIQNTIHEVEANSGVQCYTAPSQGGCIAAAGSLSCKEAQQNHALALQGEVVNLKRERVDAYEVAQRLIREVGIKIINNGVYFFNGLVYTLLQKTDMKRIIVERCRTDVKKAGRTNFIEEVYNFLYMEPDICNNDLLPSQDEVVFLDGILNLRTGHFGPPYPGFFSTTYLNASYYNGLRMPCPVFDRFISDVTRGDTLLAQRIWEALGYSLTQDHRGNCFMLLQGPPASGKSLFGNFLRGCYNKEMVCSLPMHDFSKEFALADLIGKGLCIDLDLPASGIGDGAASLLKKMTGGDLISTNVKFMNRVNFINTAQIMYATNHSVVFGNKDDGFLRRLVVVPFSYTVPPENRDLGLGERIAAERDGIIMKALQYYQALRQRNYIFAGNFPLNMAVCGYDDSLDCLVTFLRSECVEVATIWTPAQALYERFNARFGTRWPLGVFSERLNTVLSQMFPAVEKKRNRIGGIGNPVSGFQGLALADMSI